MTIIYNKATGKAVDVVHPIDVKEYIAGGGFMYENPAAKPEIPVVPKAKPAVIPTVADKQPILKPKTSSRIIKK
jgi:hypothetical protein